MPQSYRRSNAAFIGWLIFGIACSACEGLADAPNGSGVPKSPPPIEIQSSTKAENAHENPEEFSIPIWNFGTPDDAQHTKEREDKSDKHDADDLKAQQRAADAAERSATAGEGQVVAAWWQLGLAVGGTVLVILSLWLTRCAVIETRKSNNTARRAINDARISSEKDLRAYINLETAQLVPVKPIREAVNKFTVDVVFRNFGSTPAHDVELTYDIIAINVSQASVTQQLGSIGPTATIKIRESFDLLKVDCDLNMLLKHERKVEVVATIKYRTVFDTPASTPKMTKSSVVNGHVFYVEVGQAQPAGFHMFADPKGKNYST